MTPSSLFDKLSRKYQTPKAVQKLVRSLDYNREPNGETIRSAYAAWRAGEAHCLEAAFLAAAVLERHGYPPLVISLESQDKLDHVLYVFQEKSGWGAIGRSRDEGLHGRAPIFASLKKLVESYVEPFVDKTGRILAYGLANLDRTGTPWRDSPRNLWKAEDYLIEMPHTRLPTSDRTYAKLLKRYLGGTPHPRRSWWW